MHLAQSPEKKICLVSLQFVSASVIMQRHHGKYLFYIETFRPLRLESRAKAIRLANAIAAGQTA
jgi:hypothetical protein